MREYLEFMVSAQKELMSVQLTALERAVDKAESASDRRFDNVNELRGVVNDVLSKTMPRDEYQRGRDDIIERITVMERNNAERMATLSESINKIITSLSDRLTVVEGVVH